MGQQERFSESGVTSGQGVKVDSKSGVTSGQGVKVYSKSGVTSGQGVKEDSKSGVTSGQGVKVDSKSGMTCGQGVKVDSGGWNIQDFTSQVKYMHFFIRLSFGRLSPRADSYLPRLLQAECRPIRSIFLRLQQHLGFSMLHYYGAVLGLQRKHSAYVDIIFLEGKRWACLIY